MSILTCLLAICSVARQTALPRGYAWGWGHTEQRDGVFFFVLVNSRKITGQKPTQALLR